jgi:hypothetical protein
MPSAVNVFDAVLPESQFAALHAFARDSHKRQSIYGVGIWQNNQENPVEGEQTFFWSARPIEALLSLLPPGVSRDDLEKLGDLRVCPTGTPVDALFDAIAARSAAIQQQVGVVGEHFVGIIAKVYAYQRGAKATWHTDAGPYSGAFVFYAHERWKKDWGGQFLYDEDTSSADADPTDGRFVAPVPNRLLVVRGGTPHTVANVAQSAGDNQRLSVAGFFVTAGGIPQLIRDAVRDKALRAQPRPISAS